MSSYAPATKPHRNPIPLTPAERALHGALIGHATPTVIALAEETFALAACHLDDWPIGNVRLRRARRYLLAKLHGDVIGTEPTDDLWFAARLIVRALDADVGLTDLEMVALFDAIGLPIDAVPMFDVPASPRTSTARALAELLRFLDPDPDDDLD